MEKSMKMYDTVLTEGARWLAMLDKGKGPLIIAHKPESMCFLNMARVVSSYEVNIYYRAPLWKFLYMKYIKKFKFLNWPQNVKGLVINQSGFMKEMAEWFDTTPEELEELQEFYGEG